MLMKLKKAIQRTTRPMPVSFRLSNEAFVQLGVLGFVLNKSKSEVMEDILLEAYKSASRDFPKEVRVHEERLRKLASKGK